MIHFVGAGPGAPDLITVRGKALLESADFIIYAGSLVNPALLAYAPDSCEVKNSATMTLEEVIDAMVQAEADGLTTVRLHTGDPSLYGAVREQFKALEGRGIAYDVVPGVSSFSAAAAALRAEFTLPGVSQTLIITREAGRTPMPADESLASLSSHQASMVLFLSAGLVDKVQQNLLAGGYEPSTPAAVVYKASWPEEQVIHTCVGALAQSVREAAIDRTALLVVGDFLADEGERSCLYDPSFSTAFRMADGTNSKRE